MSDPLQLAANALAKAQPDYAGHSAYPPAHYWIDGSELVVIGADGRKFRGIVPAPDTKKLVPPAPAPIATKADERSSDPADTKPLPAFKPPAKHKAGK